MKSGILLINKPAGPSSHDIVDQVRKITGIRKVGHAGTLDPFAKGLLVVLVSRKTTKRQAEFLGKDKEYLATLRLGLETDSYDKTGEMRNIYDGILPSQKKIENVVKKFEGELWQTPPAYSAKKIGGKKAYQLARKGIKIKLKPAKVNIKKIKVLSYNPPFLKIDVNCSKGTYIRALAYDIGRALKCGAYLEELTRIKSGNFKLKNAINLDKLNKDNWQKYLKQK